MEYSLTVKMSEAQATEPLFLCLSYYLVGRSSLCDICIIDPKISRVHCTLILMPGDDETSEEPYYLIKDGNLLGDLSANGVYLNGSKVKIQKLNHQDEITFWENISYPKLIFNCTYEEDIEKQTLSSPYDQE